MAPHAVRVDKIRLCKDVRAKLMSCPTTPCDGVWDTKIRIHTIYNCLTCADYGKVRGVRKVGCEIGSQLCFTSRRID